MNNDITRETIMQWIYSKQNFELLLEKYFLETKENYSLNKIIFEGNQKTVQTSIGYMLNTDLRSIHSSYHELKETLLFSETDWIHPFMDIAIHKHPRFFPPFKHQHAFFELCYVLNGNCSHTVFSKDYADTLELKTGDLLIIPPDMEHSVTMNSDSAVVNILIRKSTFESTFLNNLPSDTILYTFFLNTLYAKEKQNYIVCHTMDDPELLNHFFNIAVEYCNNHIYAKNIINQEFAIFFSKLLRNHSSSIDFTEESANHQRLIPSILQYIEMNYAHINIQDIAKHFGFNASYLSRLFKLHTNRTLIDALVSIRVSKAKELLVSSEQSIDFIAEMVGYNDTTHFIRVFKKQTGKTPFQYRKQLKEKERCR